MLGGLINQYNVKLIERSGIQARRLRTPCAPTGTVLLLLRLDYCNAVFTSLPASTQAPLQRELFLVYQVLWSCKSCFALYWIRSAIGSQCNYIANSRAHSFPVRPRLRNDLLCVEWDVKPTHSLSCKSCFSSEPPCFISSSALAEISYSFKTSLKAI